MLILSYKGKVEETILKLLCNTLKAVMPSKNACKIKYTETKHASNFNIKDKTNKNLRLYLVYKSQDLKNNFNATDIGEVGMPFRNH